MNLNKIKYKKKETIKNTKLTTDIIIYQIRSNIKYYYEKMIYPKVNHKVN